MHVLVLYIVRPACSLKPCQALTLKASGRDVSSSLCEVSNTKSSSHILDTFCAVSAIQLRQAPPCCFFSVASWSILFCDFKLILMIPVPI